MPNEDIDDVFFECIVGGHLIKLSEYQWKLAKDSYYDTQKVPVLHFGKIRRSSSVGIQTGTLKSNGSHVVEASETADSSTGTSTPTTRPLNKRRVSWTTPVTTSKRSPPVPYSSEQKMVLADIWDWILSSGEAVLDEANVYNALNALNIDVRETFGPNRQVSHLVDKMQKMGLGNE